MAMKDYNASNFRNVVIDRLSGKFGKGDDPKPKPKKELTEEEKNIAQFKEMKEAIRTMPKKIPTNPMPKKVTTAIGVDKSKGLTLNEKIDYTARNKRNKKSNN